MEYSL